jgi:carbon monoxide dehydrogenase subunit G
MLKKILAVIAVILVVFVIIVALQPADFHVARTATVATPAEAVFAQVNDLKKWEAWSPWVKLDPAMKQTYEGPASGIGAVSRWAGNNQVGEGSMTITESRPHELIRFNLEFIKPMAGTSMAEFSFKPEGNQTTVTWSMSGKNNFIAKAMCLFMNMDRMVGGEFEKGLSSLKSIAEARDKK